MSTRANIIIKSGREKLIFYKHSDGYPEGTLPILNAFLDKVKSGEYRNNVPQSAGNLIILGYQEMQKDFKEWGTQEYTKSYAWKCGWIEPTTCIHDDIEYLYTIDLAKQKITVKAV